MKRVLKDRFEETIRLDLNESNQIEVDPRASGHIFISLDDSAQYNLKITAREYSYFTVFIYNRSSSETILNIESEVYKDAKVKVGLLDLEKSDFSYHVNTNLNENGADFEIFTGQLAQEDTVKTATEEIIHKAAYTYGNMHNFAVQFNKSNYEMVANGNIMDKCPGSESHQETRVLTLGEEQKTKVIPLLLIDENDVKASHALTIGQPDENQLYYLQSRGLSKEASMGLLSIGYFMPVIALAGDESRRSEIQQEMESKVGLYGHR